MCTRTAACHRFKWNVIFDLRGEMPRCCEKKKNIFFLLKEWKLIKRASVYSGRNVNWTFFVAWALSKMANYFQLLSSMLFDHLELLSVLFVAKKKAQKKRTTNIIEERYKQEQVKPIILRQWAILPFNMRFHSQQMIRAFMRAPKKPQQQRPSEKQFADNKTKEERMDAIVRCVCVTVCPSPCLCSFGHSFVHADSFAHHDLQRNFKIACRYLLMR